MTLETPSTAPADLAEVSFPSAEPKLLTDPLAMRAVAHPVRIALLDALASEGPLTATQAGQAIGESPTTCSFHLRQLAKYGFIEETGDGQGRQRPWRLSHRGFRYSDVQSDREARLAAGTLTRVLQDWYIDRLEEGMDLRRDYPAEWQKVTGLTQSLLRVTPEQMRAIDEEITEILRRHQASAVSRGQREPGSEAIEVLLFAYPRPPRRRPEQDDDVEEVEEKEDPQ
jgi:DNA-binding transcriptional ArsR family regulator